MNARQDRLNKLRRIITENRAENQEDILSMLAAEGCVVTQATLSRDLKDLKVAKAPDGTGGYHYRLPEMRVTSSSSYLEPLMPNGSSTVDGVRSLEFSGQMCVIKTRPGFANMVGSLVDSVLGHKVMGTIAGDDTLLLVMREHSDVEDIITSLEVAVPGISTHRI